MPDGLRAAANLPHCIDEVVCRHRKHCIWRAWHQIPDDKMRATPQQSLLPGETT